MFGINLGGVVFTGDGCALYWERCGLYKGCVFIIGGGVVLTYDKLNFYCGGVLISEEI